jgi:hypothetical protein
MCELTLTFPPSRPLCYDRLRFTEKIASKGLCNGVLVIKRIITDNVMDYDTKL